MLGGMDWTGKRVLLLQGPIGPYFATLAKRLAAGGAAVTKLNFNGGDRLFYPEGISYTEDMARIPSCVKSIVQTAGIDAVALFGDCRPVHAGVRELCEQLGVDLYVFEEGYFRPAYITCEKGGVNGRSGIVRDPAFYRAHPPLPPVAEAPPSRFAYHRMALWAIVYWLACAIDTGFPKYRHHRRLSVLKDGRAWIRSWSRKLWYRAREAGEQEALTSSLKGQFFLVPLQVHNDAQIVHHSDYAEVADFIEEVIESFAKNAPEDTALVLKHHPMDRAYRDYTRLIEDTAADNGIAGRVRYIHDQHLPTLLDACRGAVVVNSTVGLAAIHQGVPTKVMGKAFYDFEGLTSQRSLEEFWRDAPDDAPDMALYEAFRRVVIRDTQVNDNFYAPLQKGKLISNPGRRRPDATGKESRESQQARNQAQGARPAL